LSQSSTDVAAAADCYDSDDTAAFYRLCWGGADIHIGRYETGHETVAEASTAMTRYLLGIADLREDDRVLDIACGYGGTLRELARLGCRAAGMDISRVCVEQARRALSEAGLADEVSVDLGDFHDIDSPADAWDALVCQESIIHSPDRPRVFAEAHRVLKPGGVFAVSDILTTDRAEPGVVAAAFDRLRVQDFATQGDYEAMAQEAGFRVEHAEERRHDIATHYAKLAEALDPPPAGLDPAAATRIAASIGDWREAIEGGHVTWACFVLRSPEA
jgi:cyclopropane fatty-acyl-phospholipid synthase-like methyltransferase